MVNNILKYQSLSKKFYRKCFEDLQKKYNLTSLEIDIIMFINNYEQLVTASDIVEIKGFTKSNVSTAIKNLSDKLYIECYYLGKNRRSIYLRLLPKSNDIIEDGLHAEQIFVNTLLDGFSDSEKETMQINFSRIINNIKKTS